MAYRDLQSFLKKLEACKELKKIEIPVSTELEMTEIVDRISKARGPALLFQHAKGFAYPVVMNVMGSEKRMSMALGVSNPDDIGAEIAEYLNFERYLSVRGLIKSIPRLLRLLHVFPRRSRRRGVCQQVIEREPDLFSLPVLKCWPQDAGRFFTLPLIFAKEANSRRQNVGMYRMQILDKTSTAMHWHRHKDGSEIFLSYAKSGRRMPLAVALGCDPAITYAATSPLPKMVDEIMFAGWLRKARVKMVKCITNDIYVPADAEFVLEGYVDPKEELVREGPFGDHTGYYSLADDYPRFHVTCITHKKEPVYPATVVGKPPMEDCYMAKATERIFLPFLRLQIPELVDLNLPLEGVFHNCAIVSIRSHYPGMSTTKDGDISMKNNKIVLVIMLLTLSLIAAGCSKEGEAVSSGEGKPVIRIGMMSSSDVIPFVLINENKLSDKYHFKLDLQVFTSAKDRDAALQAGELDGVLTDYIGVCMYQNAGFDVKITGITDGDYILLAGKDSGITDIRQIKGKSIAISEKTLIEYTLDYILDKNGLDDTDVVKEVVPRIPDRLELLRNDKINLGLMPEPFATLALKDGEIPLGTANEYGLYPAVSAFSKTALDSKNEAIRNLYKAYNEAVDYMNHTDIQQYEETVIDAVGYPKEMVGKITVKPFRKSALPPEEDVEAAVRWASEKGLCKPTLTYEQMTYDVYSESD